jgi:hypothetical protein
MLNRFRAIFSRIDSGDAVHSIGPEVSFQFSIYL